MNFGYLCLVFAAFFAVGYSRDIYVNTSSQLATIMKGALPGDNVFVAPGSYQIETQASLPWYINAKGTSDKPIVMSCAVKGLCVIADPVVLASASYLSVVGFSVGTSSAFDAMTVQDSSHVTLDTIQFHDGDDSNLWIVRSSYCTVKSSTFERTNRAVHVHDSSDNTITSCTFGKYINDLVLYIENSTRCEFSNNEVYASESSYGGGSWVVEYDAGGNMFSSNNFGFSFSKYQKTLNGYLAKGTCLYGPTTLKNNYMDLKNGVGFAGCKDYKNRVCASNVVAGATITDGDIDQSC